MSMSMKFIFKMHLPIKIFNLFENLKGIMFRKESKNKHFRLRKNIAPYTNICYVMLCYICYVNIYVVFSPHDRIL